MRIDRDSYGSLAIVLVIGLLLGFVFVYFVRIPWIVWPMLAAIAWMFVWQLAFFRVPVRRRNGSSHAVSSVADGRVVIVEKAFESEYLCRECIQISVYMNFFDVHANFWPVDGKVAYFRYVPGEHLLAFRPKASLKNEHSCVCIENEDGTEVFFKQIAGGFARRVVCRAEESSEVRAGEQCGIIKFGSRIDIFLPTDAEVKVKVGDTVRACETILAILPASSR